MRRFLLGFAALMLLAAVSTPAGAGLESHDVTGRWRGALQARGDPNLRGEAELSVTSQEQGMFTGTFVFPSEAPWPSEPCTVQGEVFESLKMVASGDCGAKTRLRLQGQITGTDEHGVVPDIFMGLWRLSGLGGRNMSGDLALLHLRGGPVSLAEGYWAGQAMLGGDPRVPLLADLMQDRVEGTGRGWFEVGDPFFEVTFDIAEHPDSDTHGFGAVGVGEGGIIVIHGGFVPPSDTGAPSMIDAHIVIVMPGGETLEGDMSARPAESGGNNPPMLQGVGDRSVPAGGTAAIDMQCFDPDATTTTIQNTKAGPDSSFDQTSGNPASGSYRQVTSTSQVGQVFNVDFVCTDSGNPPASDTKAARITVLAPCPPKCVKT